MRALLLAWRALGDCLIHSSSRASVFWRAASVFGFLLKPLLLLLQPGRVVALVRDAVAAIEFQNPAGHIVQEVAIMGDQHDGACVSSRTAPARRPIRHPDGWSARRAAACRASGAAACTARPGGAHRPKLVTSAVPGRAAQRVHRHLDLRWRSQASAASILSCNSACSSSRRVSSEYWPRRASC